MRYWQHEETGRCTKTENEVSLSRHIEITKKQYDAHENICRQTIVEGDNKVAP